MKGAFDVPFIFLESSSGCSGKHYYFVVSVQVLLVLVQGAKRFHASLGGNMKIFRRRDSYWLCSVVFFVVALMIPLSSDASDVRRLWQSRDQFVALERQDPVPSGHVLHNDHPVRIDIERLTAILSSIDMRDTDGGKPESLFTKPALQVLAPQLQQALQQAAPGEDVTFAIIGLHDTLYGLAKSPKVTTGRVFYQGGKLHIIVGLVHKDVSDRDDRRLSPFTPGSRQKAPAGEWTLLPQSGKNGFTLVRKDWVSFSDEWSNPDAPAPVVEKAAPVPVPSTSTVKQPSDTRTPAERLTILNELKSKGLITEEEFRTKRLEILNGL
jgi:hypothetical protein